MIGRSRRWGLDRLTVRVPLAVLAIQAALIAAAMLAFPLTAPFTSYQQIADTSVRRLVEGSLAAGPDGALSIRPTPALASYAARRPILAFAAARPGGSPAAGSDPALASLLRRFGADVPRPDGNFEIRNRRGPGSIFVSVDRTPLGAVVIATSGNRFLWEDAPSFLDTFLPAIIPAYGPLLLGGLLVLPLLMRRMLRPLQRLAVGAGQIQPTAMDERLPTHGLPGELRPAVDEINAALDRLGDGWERQRLFTANAAHELRTPVAVLQSRIDSLPRAAPESAALARDARRMKLLVDQLLTVARLGHQPDRCMATVDLVPLVRAVVADCAPLALRSGLSIEFLPLDDRVAASADARAVEGAIANLIDNALHADPAGGSIEVMVALDGGALVSVRDHGSGVAPADRELVFEPFWRKDERKPGTGLGLAAVREVALMHGGTADVVETAGGGATFRLLLPSASPTQ